MVLAVARRNGWSQGRLKHRWNLARSLRKARRPGDKSVSTSRSLRADLAAGRHSELRGTAWPAASDILGCVRQEGPRFVQVTSFKVGVSSPFFFSPEGALRGGPTRDGNEVKIIGKGPMLRQGTNHNLRYVVNGPSKEIASESKVDAPTPRAPNRRAPSLGVVDPWLLHHKHGRPLAGSTWQGRLRSVPIPPGRRHLLPVESAAPAPGPCGKPRSVSKLHSPGEASCPGCFVRPAKPRYWQSVHKLLTCFIGNLEKRATLQVPSPGWLKAANHP